MRSVTTFLLESSWERDFSCLSISSSTFSTHEGAMSLLSSLKLRLNLLQSLGNLIILFVSIFSLISSIFEFLLQLAHSFLILDSPVLQNLPHSVRVISSSGSLVQLVGGLEELVLTGLQISLKCLDSPVESIDLKLCRLEVVFLLLQSFCGQRKLLLGLVKLNLQLLSLLDKVSHFLLSLGCPHLGILGGLLTDIRPVHGIVLLHLHGLHLLLDGIHGCFLLLYELGVTPH